MATRKITKARCTVCHHPERHRIEMLRLAGTSVPLICERFPDLGRMSIHRHMAAHVDDALKAEMVADVPLAELAERAVAEGGSLLDHFAILRFTVEGQLRRAAAINDFKSVSGLTRQALEVNNAIGKLSGELLNSAPVRNYNQTTITIGDPRTMDRMEAMLVERLAPFPGALQAVQAGLLALSAPEPSIIDVTPHEASHAA